MKEYQIGIEGEKRELMDFIDDFDFSKIVVGIIDGQAIISIVAPLDKEVQHVFEQIRQENIN